jgi:hypothetical protein
MSKLSRDIEYEVFVEPLTLDHYRLGWAPAEGFHHAGKWIAASVTGESGLDYFGLRAYGDNVLGMTHTISPTTDFRSLQRDTNEDPSRLFPEYGAHDLFEPFEYGEGDDKVSFVCDRGCTDETATTAQWVDADNRWEIQGKVISDAGFVFVPEQEGIELPVYYRHELSTATGVINGDPVEGYFHEDFCYGPPGYTYMELPLVRQLEGKWFSWIHEYADGELGGGCVWQGRDDLNFRPGYMMNRGITTAHKDADITLEKNENGQPRELRLEMGGEWFEFNLHTISSVTQYFGNLTASSPGKQIVKSWCWLEHLDGLVTEQIFESKDTRFKLARRHEG